MAIYLLPDDRLIFPHPCLASKDGLLAIKGDLSEDRLLMAYSLGIFPWYSEGEEILWWSPDPRLVIFPDELRVSRSLKKIIRQKRFKITMDQAFDEVIFQCAQIRRQNGEGTWIVNEMQDAYCRLHKLGFAHSVEIWVNEKLVGGLYGVSLGRTFFGESMFSKKSNTSKIALVALIDYIKKYQFDMIDCQLTTNHLMRMGAREISRIDFLKKLQESLKWPTLRGKWTQH
ncbi:Leucyl/phenylalanyl-tRNA--protein transferase [Candidatus Magnetomoraceae bacterium gMMP-15]